MKFVKKFLSNKLILLAIFSLALGLRVIHFNKITFAYDQARDAIQAIEIWKSDPIKILGPRTDFEGVYHGPLYWYLISPVYFITNGNVLAVRFFLIFLNALGVFLIYNLAFKVSQDKTTSLISAFFYAVSFELTQYGRWLSNPAPAVLTILLSLIFFWNFLKGKKYHLALSLFFWGLSVQFEFFLIYHILILGIIWLLYKGYKLPKLSIKQILASVSGIILSLSPFIASELKFNFQGTKSLLAFFSTQSLFHHQFSDLLIKYLNRFSQIFYFNLWGINLMLAGIIGFITIYLSLRKSILQKSKKLILPTVLVLSPIFLHMFTGSNAIFINLGAGLGAIIITSIFINKYLIKNKIYLVLILVLAFVALGNFNNIYSINKQGEVLFSVQHKTLLDDELKLIDWIYKESNNKKYRLNTITNPLFINTTWSYLFNWYGKSTYGYMPAWWGEPQVNVFGQNIEFNQPNNQNDQWLYLIIEPGPGIRDEHINAIKKLENSRSKVVETKQFGTFTVEKRKITKPERIYTNQDVFYEILKK